MASEPDAPHIDFYLISAVGQIAKLVPPKTHVCGRGADADIVVPDNYISRRHAELRWDPQSFWTLVDLGSRNGSLVNGTRVEQPTQLLDHAQIQFGGQLYTYFMVPPGTDPKTLATHTDELEVSATLEMASSDEQNRSTIQGAVDRAGLLDLIQFFTLTKRTGRLELSGPGDKAIWFVDGALRAARYGDHSGEGALTDLCLSDTERFEFHADELVPEGEAAISGSPDQVLMNLTLALDNYLRAGKASTAEAEGPSVEPDDADDDDEAAPAAPQSASPSPPSPPPQERPPAERTPQAVKVGRAQVPDFVGRTFGQVTLTSMIGYGHCAQVYRGKHKALDRDFAVKVMLSRDELHDERSRKRFLKEAQISSAIKHDNVIAVSDAGVSEDNLVYIVLELVEGPSLGQLKESRAQMSADELIPYALGIAEGLKVIHERGVIHRDLKPDNVLIAPDGTPKIADLGLARALDDDTVQRLTATGICVGTPLYMAPEAVTDSHGVTPKADIYSLGVTMYELLSGVPPFEGATPFEVMTAHLKETPRPLSSLVPDLDHRLSALVHRCLERDPDKRPDAAELAESLRKLKGERVSSGRLISHVSVPAALRQDKRKRKDASDGASLAVKIVVCSVVGLLVLAIVLAATLGRGS